MSRKYKFIFCGIAFALAAIIAGFCLVFFGSKTIKAVPNSIEVKRIGSDYFLVSEFSGQYNYKFKLEQDFDGEYLTVGFVDSKLNAIKLDDANLNIIPGAIYRFSVKFTNENGGGKGKFSKTIIWSPSRELEQVDYAKVNFVEDVLSWETVPYAERYRVIVVDEHLNEREFVCPEKICNLTELDPGRYVAYIFAESDDQFTNLSDGGEGKVIIVKRKNNLTNVRIENGCLRFDSMYEVEKVEIFVNGELLGTVEVSTISEKNYTTENLTSLFDGVDLRESEISVKTLTKNYVLESEKTLISVL